MTLTINTDRLLRELDQLALITDCPPIQDRPLPGTTQAVTRIVFTPRDLEARAWLKELVLAAGFTVREDAVGNTFLRWEGTDPGLGAVGTGSHTDAIPYAGMYDGTVGVLGGLEAMRSLKESGFIPKRAIELLMLTSEEPTRFGIGCIGSRLLGGVIDPEAADRMLDRLPETDASAPTGLTLANVRQAAGFHGSLASVKLPIGHYHAWVELHIEQGPLLEREGIELGIVTNIAAPASYRYTVEGFGGHAGALLMPDRRDALCAAAEMILSVERHARAANTSSGGVDTVATIGMVGVYPGAVNSVPSRVTLILDLRDTDVARRDGVLSAFHADIAEIEQRRGVSVQEEIVNADAPARSSEHIVETVEAICKAEGVGYKKMVSRAYHDSSFIAAVAPTAMLFIPSRAGVSHKPDEYSTPESIAVGTRVLALALAKLANE
ncbi:M20 family metallo-hydrolase [Granulicella mallensis]|uniref:N-carbamoyl-L-amino-acid hydrolase n=1 Tax=Granulicella mallensis TaxID=940614 RepID=A0A7W8EAY7_9BACT|nr:M20 family metallo-hydrolase [Granulicella mallensis]MBB5065282.1 N-carbamoyl-L-amino-acid hydrolase [Granulicella mallensis]